MTWQLALMIPAAAFFFAALYGFFGGYPRHRFASRVLSAKEQAVLTACADTLFPDRAVMPRSGSEAGVVEYLDEHLSHLPGIKRFQVRLLFAFIEHSPWIFNGWRRFTALDEKRRAEFLFEMAQSRIYFRRICFLSLRTLSCMAYLAHPEIAARIGCAPNPHPFRVAS